MGAGCGGLLTADGFDNLRALIDPKRRSGQGNGRSARPRHSAGRWSLLYAGEAGERSRALEATCRMLLHRYGIVFREVLSRETILPKWRELLITLRRLEDRGEVEVEGSSAAFWANNSRCRWRWNRCGDNETRRRLEKWSLFRRRTR